MARHTAKSHKIRKVEILVIQTVIFGGIVYNNVSFRYFAKKPCKYLDGLTVVISGRFRYHTLVRKFKETSPKKNNEKQKSGGFSNGKFIIKERLQSISKRI